jgi:hypothetical protein
MKKILTGILLGVAAGIIDVIPMILQKLPLDADLSAFCMWVVAGFMISISELKISGILKGILISFLLLIPSAIIIAWKEPFTLIPISAMTLVLGSALGFAVEKFTR